jgi:sporulation protein YlmC with PRC-barrel domain
MLKTKKLNDVFSIEVFTDSGQYFGDVEESILTNNKVFGWRVKATRKSYLTKILGGAKGVIVPHQLVKSIGDVMIISNAAIPKMDDEDGME